MHFRELDHFARAYVECALWSSSDESDEQGGEPLDANYSVEDIHPETLDRIVADCEKFREQAGELLSDENWEQQRSEWDYEEQAGHDFWLTRNHHGAGFWDGNWTEPAATKLTELSRAFGECDLYAGDDGKLYI